MLKRMRCPRKYSPVHRMGTCIILMVGDYRRTDCRRLRGSEAWFLSSHLSFQLFLLNYMSNALIADSTAECCRLMRTNSSECSSLSFFRDSFPFFGMTTRSSIANSAALFYEL